MNCFRRFLIGAALAAFFLSGCAKDNATMQAEASALTAASQVQVEKFKADQEQAKAVQRLADKIDAGGASAYLVTTALKGLGIGQAPAQQQAQQPQSLLGLAWQSALQVADIALRGYGIKANRDVSMAQSNANRDVSIASFGAFTSMGNAIGAAGTAGYQYVQAPGAVTTTTNNTTTTSTLSGTGVLGSGTYTAPVTTTRTCNGGTAAAGGGGTTGTAGSGGGAPGGSC